MSENLKDKFDSAANFTFHPQVEGGYTVDNGGPTNYGITQTTLDNFNKKNGFPNMNVKDMTMDDAKFVAKRAYFDEPGFNNLPDRLSVAAFDYSINSGPFQAIKDLQRTVGAKPDGKLGQDTIKAINNYVSINGEESLLNDYADRRSTLMNNLITTNPSKYGKYADGWSARINNLKEYLGLNSSVQGEE